MSVLFVRFAGCLDLRCVGVLHYCVLCVVRLRARRAALLFGCPVLCCVDDRCVFLVVMYSVSVPVAHCPRNHGLLLFRSCRMLGRCLVACLSICMIV